MGAANHCLSWLYADAFLFLAARLRQDVFLRGRLPRESNSFSRAYREYTRGSMSTFWLYTVNSRVFDSSMSSVDWDQKVSLNRGSPGKFELTIEESAVEC